MNNDDHKLRRTSVSFDKRRKKKEFENLLAEVVLNIMTITSHMYRYKTNTITCKNDVSE